MSLNQMQVKKLLTYTGKMQISQLGLSLLVTRLSRTYNSNPSAQLLESATAEMNVFISKFAAIMDSDYKWIISL